MKKQPTTHLGNPHLHKRHSVMIEGGTRPRARVMDQTVFDFYLGQGLLSLGEFSAAEHMIGLARIAGLWAKGVNNEGTGGAGFGPRVPFGVAPFFGALRVVRQAAGAGPAGALLSAIRDDSDVRTREGGLRDLKLALRAVRERVLMGYTGDPARHIRKAKKKRPQPLSRGRKS